MIVLLGTGPFRIFIRDSAPYKRVRRLADIDSDFGSKCNRTPPLGCVG
jgi:hypothetical protein